MKSASSSRIALCNGQIRRNIRSSPRSIYVCSRERLEKRRTSNEHLSGHAMIHMKLPNEFLGIPISTLNNDLTLNRIKHLNSLSLTRSTRESNAMDFVRIVRSLVYVSSAIPVPIIISARIVRSNVVSVRRCTSEAIRSSSPPIVSSPKSILKMCSWEKCSVEVASASFVSPIGNQRIAGWPVKSSKSPPTVSNPTNCNEVSF